MRRLLVSMVTFAIIGCSNNQPLEPLTSLPHAKAVPACGPADGPATFIYLGSTPVELPDPDVPFIRVFVPTRFTESTPGDEFEIGDDFNTEASAWFYRSGVEAQSARRGDVTITALRGNELTGHVDLEFPDGVRMRGSFIAAWQNLVIVCG